MILREYTSARPSLAFAEECIAFVSQAANQPNGEKERQRELSDLFLTARQVHMLAKNLQLLPGE